MRVNREASVAPVKLIACLLVVSCLLGAGKASSARSGPFKVGLYDNRPLCFLDEAGRPRGVYVDLLEELGRRKGFSFEYVHGLWEELLGKLESGEIDLLLAVAYSPQRALTFDFNRKPVILNYGVIFKRRDDPKSYNLFDLAGKRIGVNAGDIYYVGPLGIKRTLEAFAVEATFVELESFPAVAEALRSGEVDLAVLPRLHGTYNAEAYGISPTDVFFSPVELRIAAPRGRSAEVLAAVDEILKDDGRIAEEILGRYLPRPNPLAAFVTRHPNTTLLVLTFLVLSFLALQLHRHQLKVKIAEMTFELQAKNEELRAQLEELTRANSALQEMAERLNFLATRDPLTGAHNRNAFNEYAKRLIALKRPFSLAYLDLDHFKEINDELGHDAGDEILKGFARTVAENLPEGLVFARHGGDEFAILMPDLSPEEAASIAERIRQKLQHTPIQARSMSIRLSMSFGISSFPEDGEELDQLVRAADQRMYHSKKERA